MKTKLLVILLLTSLVGKAQTDFKQVYDKSLEKQIKSSVGKNDEWEFHPGWYYSIFHNKYKSGDNENNNKIYLDSLIDATSASLLKVLQARKDIEIIYQNELAHWNDRTNDWELTDMQRQLENARKVIGDVFAEFPTKKVPSEDRLNLFEELSRIDEKVKTLSKAHLDNGKRKQGFEKCLEEYNRLYTVSYKLLHMSYVASKIPIE